MQEKATPLCSIHIFLRFSNRREELESKENQAFLFRMQDAS